MQVSPDSIRFVCICVYFFGLRCVFFLVSFAYLACFLFVVVLPVPVVSSEDAAVSRSRRKLLLDYRRRRAAGNSLFLFSVFCCFCSTLCSFLFAVC